MIDLEATGLAATDEEVARLTMPQRRERVRRLIDVSHQILADAIEDQRAEGRDVPHVVILYSGGNDSTVLAHLFKDRATHTGHANTGIGVEATRQFVRDTSAVFGLSLIERHPPAGSTYRDLVLDQGFPGPAMHWKMYQRLKERCLEQIRKELVDNPYRERVIFLAGRRRQESERRANVPVTDRKGSMVFVSPLVLWTAPDMTTYRIMKKEEGDPVPINDVSKLIHMSGECLCGSFAHKGEFEEIGMWFPEVTAYIEALEAEVREENVRYRVEHLMAAKAILKDIPVFRGDHAVVANLLAHAAEARRKAATPKIPYYKTRWGWGADKDLIKQLLKSGMSDDEVAELFSRSASGPLCTSCENRAEGGDALVAS